MELIGAEKEENRKREGGKLKIGGKVTKWEEDFPPPFFFCCSLFKTTEICFGSTKMGIFYREKAFHARLKIRKNDFAPSEFPLTPLGRYYGNRCQKY